MLSSTQLYGTELYFGETCHIVPQLLALKEISIMEGCGNRVSCRNVLKKLQILPLTLQYKLSSLMFVVHKKKTFS